MSNDKRVRDLVDEITSATVDKIINEEKWLKEQVDNLNSLDEKDIKKKKMEITEVKNWAHSISMEELVREIEIIRQRYRLETRNLFHLYIFCLLYTSDAADDY